MRLSDLAGYYCSAVPGRGDAVGCGDMGQGILKHPLAYVECMLVSGTTKRMQLNIFFDWGQETFNKINKKSLEFSFCDSELKEKLIQQL